MKNEDALKTISEVSKELSVEKHVIRFWETKFKGLKPIQKNKGRRYYSRDDVRYLRKIIDLLYTQNYSIKGALKKIDNDKSNNSEIKKEIILDLEVIKKKIESLL